MHLIPTHEAQAAADKVTNELCVTLAAANGLAQAETIIVVWLNAFAGSLAMLRGPDTASEHLYQIADGMVVGGKAS
ncbi:hypothetical protein V7S57_02350 [Caulobacter sp. CCNWLY153]|uniref:hypothetical protein n=1 Tax=unclassified Caulobacter TaxID=2648921 RepID=UPI002FF2C9BB